MSLVRRFCRKAERIINGLRQLLGAKQFYYKYIIICTEGTLMSNLSWIGLWWRMNNGAYEENLGEHHRLEGEIGMRCPIISDALWGGFCKGRKYTGSKGEKHS